MSYFQRQKAEENHKKAIKIKTDLLGESDFEVALSLGHLASLYNYDMKRYSEAEKLHLRSISISECIFAYPKTLYALRSFHGDVKKRLLRVVGLSSYCWPLLT